MIKIAAIAAPAMILFGVGFPYVMFHLVSPPPGSPLAVLNIQSGKPFALPFVANGEAPRAFLDMACESCSFPVSGTLTLWVGDKEVDRARISAGDARDRAWGGHDRHLVQHLLYDGPDQPAGTRVVLKGTLLVGPARGTWSTAPVKGAPPPRVRVLRLTVAP